MENQENSFDKFIEEKISATVDKDKYITYKRGKGKYIVKNKVLDMYRFYIENLVGNFEHTDYNITNKNYTAILRRVSELIVDQIINNNFEYTLPYRMGKLFIYKKKMKLKLDENGDLIKKYMSIDYQATKKMWLDDPKSKEDRLKVYHTNDHSNGYKYYFHWQKKDIIVKPFWYYSLKMIRDNNRYMAKCAKNDPSLDYYDSDLIKIN